MTYSTISCYTLLGQFELSQSLLKTLSMVFPLNPPLVCSLLAGFVLSFHMGCLNSNSPAKRKVFMETSQRNNLSLKQPQMLLAGLLTAFWEPQT